MNLEQFIETFVTLENQEDGRIGYYPFNMQVKKTDGNMEITSFVGVDVFTVYRGLYAALKKEDTQSLILAIDFPAMDDVTTDFVIVYSWDNTCVINDVKIIILPYSQEKEFLPRVTEGITYNIMKEELQRALSFIIHKDA